MATKKKAAANKKPAAKKKAAGAAARNAGGSDKRIAVRRPAPNEPIGIDFVDEIDETLNELKTEIENFAAHLRALDRKRVNGMGIKRQGFAVRAYELATGNAEFLPHWLPVSKFKDDIDVFMGIRNVFDTNRQIQEMIWNLVMIAADMAYTDSLEFYSSVKSAAERRIDAAESVYEEMVKFFSRGGMSRGGRLTEKELKKDAIAVIEGRKDGKILLEHKSPKMIKGSSKAIDETFKSKDLYRETETGDFES